MSRLNIYGQGISTTKKKPCIVATTGNITLSGVTTPTIIDGVNISVGNRILVWQQNSPQENGIYRLKTTQLLLRDYDFIINEDVYGGVEVLVLSGATYSGKTFYLTTSGDITIGSSSLSFNVLAGQNGTSGSSGTSGSNAGITSYTNPADNRVITSVSSTAINAEANLTFDGSLLSVNTTSAIKIPIGTTDERPLTPSVGMIRLNTTLGSLEIYYGTSWISYFNFPISVEYLVIAGGGGGGAVYGGGGGGAGGYLTNTFTLNKNTSYTVTVGGGGGGVTDNEGNNGNSSSISGTGITTISSDGGGGAGKYRNPIGTNGKNGGSGGGGGSSDATGSANYTSGGTATTGQGKNGGTGGRTGTPLGGGGGGGADTSGGNWSGSTAGNGGNGLASSITGTNVTRAAGGGGGAAGGLQGGTPGVAGTGKVGTDGDGGVGNSNGNNGTDFRGNGGGGGGQPGYAGGNGGKGVVIVRWFTSSATITLSGGAEIGTVSYTDGSYSIREIKNSGTITFS